MSTIKANTLLHSDGSTTTQPSIPALDQRMAKAWVNFNSVGTVAVRDSYNVSSVTDNGVGNHQVNFAINMPNSQYSAVASARYATVNGEGMLSFIQADATSYVRVSSIFVHSSNYGVRDFDSVYVQVFGN